MKKIVAGAAVAALTAGLVFADGPVANVQVTDFTGNAQVQWGVDLDAGATGFKNSEYMKFVINLFDAGTKATTGDDVWAEIEMKAGNTGWWAHRLFEHDSNVDFNAAEQNVEIKGSRVSFDITAAKIHFGDAYVGIQNGDTVTGDYGFDAAIRSNDNGNGKWLENVGRDGYTQGIVVGYGNNNLGIEADFRSKPQDNKNQYTNDYAVALEAKLKDSNEWVGGLAVGAGVSYNLSDVVSSDAGSGKVAKTDEKIKAHTLGYSANAAYKLSLDEKTWLKPAVGLTGTVSTNNNETTKINAVSNANTLVAGVILGWGSTADTNAGLYYFDTDATKKVTPGVSVVANIPLASTSEITVDGKKTKGVAYDKALAIIAPSFFTNGELVAGLKAAAYSEMVILNGEDKTEVSGDTTTKKAGAKNKEDTFALALAAAVAYDIKADDITVTPQVGVRFANATYFDNAINGYKPFNSNIFFDGMGSQKVVDDTSKKATGSIDGNFFNLKAGVNVNGLINNTDFFCVYQSANLLNGLEYVEKTGYKYGAYNVKAGTLNVGCKISL